jgi:phosphoglucosamine mutase
MNKMKMTRKFFGTDGIRGKVGVAPITPDFVMRLGYAAGKVLAQSDSESRPTVLIGKDTRISGYMLEASLEAGFSAAGVDVMLCGSYADASHRLSDESFALVGRGCYLSFTQSF